MTEEIKDRLMEWAVKYNDPFYFVEDPVSFPREFRRRGASLQDIEIAAVFAAHFAWGRRNMIVRDLERFFDFLEWKPLDYVKSGDYRDEEVSVHRTIKWSETAGICRRLQEFYFRDGTVHSLEELTVPETRSLVFSQKDDSKAPNKKINLMKRWMVRDDGKVDLGLWKKTPKTSLVVPLDVHVYDEAVSLGLTGRKQKDIVTAKEITEEFSEIWPDDPLLGDFALFGYGVTKGVTKKDA